MRNRFMKALRFILGTDGYKLDHRRQYPLQTEWVLDNGTARRGRNPLDVGVLFAGLQGFIEAFFMDDAQYFFDAPRDVICAMYQEFLDNFIGPNSIGVEHIGALHDLGYIPLEIRALEEGTFVPYGVPMWTIESTHPDFFWLPNYFETNMSCEMWMPITSASTAKKYRELLNIYGAKTSDADGIIPFQAHDFSMRGMPTKSAAEVSGFGHLLSFTGSDNIPSILWAMDHYDATGFVAGGVPATEHAVMCAGGDKNERETFKRLLELYPTGIVSIVSDTWNLWTVLTEHLPALKAEIMARDGKMVVRPDSGDPADILCGDPTAAEGSPRWYGVIRLLDKIFGHTVNSKGYKDLDSHIGAIYGDSITLERAEDILSRLEQMGYASTNVVLGVGSFTYQYVTRDTHNFAIKATAAKVDGVERMLFKDPVTDDGMKKSAKGRLAVIQSLHGELKLIDQLDEASWNALGDQNLLKPVWKNGEFVRRTTLAEIRERVAA